MVEPDVLRPVSRETTASFIANQIRRGIMSGAFPPGSQLGEADLAGRFQVSRGPLREAMQRLVQEGLLHSERHRGLFVTTLGPEDVEDMYLARRVVEKAAVSALVRCGGDDDLRPLRGAVRAMETAGRRRRWPALADADVRFHEALVAASGSRRLLRMGRTLLVETRMCLATLEPLRSFAQIAEGHREILAALEAEDETTAFDLLDAHMDDARDELTQRPS